MPARELKQFSPEEHETWRSLYDAQTPKRDLQIHPMFCEGLRKAGITRDRIPSLVEVNMRLEPLGGFGGVPVAGLEEHGAFFELLSRRLFPVGDFIRDRRDLSYTPAPDVFHDLYGHLPFFADRDYADFCAGYGRVALKHRAHPEKLEKLARLFWFTIEFALIQTPQGKRVFGAGIASSFGECEYALSERPEVLPFDLERIMNQPFKIDEFQRRLFILEDVRDLYGSLEEIDRKLSAVA